jgi:serine/threonine-protein kinase RsbW
VITVGGMRWRKVFRGEERQLGAMRRWLASLLPAVPARDDVILVATELASNAICHTASGRGGWFTVEITWWRSVVRVGVTDCGGPARPQVAGDPAGERGRGLLLVTGLSLRTGACGDQQGRLVWADVRWDGPGPAAGAVMPRTAPARGRRGEPGHHAASVQCQRNNEMPRSA